MSEAVERAVAWALAVANDNANGYDQTNRWGPDYDCSSLVISAFEAAGVPVKTGGATYTGNMKRVFTACGFRDVKSYVNLSTGSGLVRGDVLLNQAKHTALYLGGGQLVHASKNENGRATGGKAGDQTGAEICQRSYYNYPWDCVLRYEAPAAGVDLPVLRSGSVGRPVMALQALLNGYGYGCGSVDGDLGVKTNAALKRYQGDMGLEVDGICGSATWGALLGM